MLTRKDCNHRNLVSLETDCSHPLQFRKYSQLSLLHTLPDSDFVHKGRKYLLCLRKGCLKVSRRCWLVKWEDCEIEEEGDD